jgi:hypothetical protein
MLLSGYLVSTFERGLTLTENLEFQPKQRYQHLVQGRKKVSPVGTMVSENFRRFKRTTYDNQPLGLQDGLDSFSEVQIWSF